jgi:hypothetical protein
MIKIIALPVNAMLLGLKTLPGSDDVAPFLIRGKCQQRMKMVGHQQE